MFWLWLAGCVAHHRAPADPFAGALSAADEAWGHRAESGGLDAAERAYTALLAERPGAPEVLWRLARLQWSHALIDPAHAGEWHEAGREFALRCVAADPALAEALATAGDRLSTATLAISTAPAQCLVFGAAHIVALVEARGPGAALDLEDALPLAARAAQAGPAVEPALRSWALGRAGVLMGSNPGESRDAMRTAVALAPGLRFFRDEAVSAFPDLAESFDAFVPAPGWTLENGGD